MIDLPGTYENPHQLGTAHLPLETVMQPTTISIVTTEGEVRDGKRYGTIVAEVTIGGRKNDWISANEYEFVCAQLELAKTYIRRWAQ